MIETSVSNRNTVYAVLIGGTIILTVLISCAAINTIKNTTLLQVNEQPAAELVTELMEVHKVEEKKQKPVIVINTNLDASRVLQNKNTAPAQITKGIISSKYGYRSTFGRFHHGLDIAAPIGTPINAYKGGIVTYSGRRGTYGLMIEIDHGNGEKTRYAHCSALYFRKGEEVECGEHIADIGNTGRSTGPHLHFELLRNGKSINPANLF